MKFRIAAVLAVALFIGGIAAYLWDFREPPGAENPQSTSVGDPAKMTQNGVPAAQPSLSVPSSDGRPNTPAVPVAPVNVVKVAPPTGNLPPTPASKPNKPVAPDVHHPTPPAPATPPPPANPEVTALAAIEVDKVGLMLRDYRTRMGENPTGTNAEIMKAVMGGNPKKARLGPPEGQQINGNGELVDRWGTPYFFHQMSKNDMEIRSAGPDQQLWTADDIVGR